MGQGRGRVWSATMGQGLGGGVPPRGGAGEGRSAITGQGRQGGCHHGEGRGEGQETGLPLSREHN